jgi:hypothetical protein
MQADAAAGPTKPGRADVNRVPYALSVMASGSVRPSGPSDEAVRGNRRRDETLGRHPRPHDERLASALRSSLAVMQPAGPNPRSPGGPAEPPTPTPTPAPEDKPTPGHWSSD